MGLAADRRTAAKARRTIVVGAGSSGGVVAARLSEDASEQVTLIEAGPDYPSTEDMPEPLRDANNPQLVGHDWGLEAYFLEPPDERDAGPYPRGRLVGGTSAINGCIAHRGTPADFEAWVAKGNDMWSWSDVLPFYKRLERDVDYGADTAVHGDTGPVPIVRRRREEWSPVVQAFDVAVRARGFGACADMNAPTATGFGPVARNEIGALRASTLVTYLSEARSRPNLEIRAETAVKRVLFDGCTAVGVEVEHTGRRERIEGDRVVLSAGSLLTPQLLTLSGVGRAGTLEQLGIEPVAISEGVGRNLRDHPYVPLVALASDESPSQRYGLSASLRCSSGNNGDGDDVLIVPALLETASMNFDTPTAAPGAVILFAILAKPRSTGWIDVTSSDQSISPVLHMNFLSEPEDVASLTSSVRLCAEIMSCEPVSAELGERLVFPGDRTLADDAALVPWIREMVTTGFHAVGSCRMGPDEDREAVVDQRLAVRGTERLYIADASVMPDIPTGLTNITCYMIGERLASWLRDA